MRLRTRLAIAFVLMSVVPLAVITLYSYSSSIAAFRRAVEAQETAVAADMGKRMELVTAAVGDRMDRVSTAVQARNWTTRDRAEEDRFRQEVASVLGDAAGFVSSLQFITAPPRMAPPPPGARGYQPQERAGRFDRRSGSRGLPPGVPPKPAGPRTATQPAEAVAPEPGAPQALPPPPPPRHRGSNRAAPPSAEAKPAADTGTGTGGGTGTPQPGDATSADAVKAQTAAKIIVNLMPPDLVRQVPELAKLKTIEGLEGTEALKELRKLDITALTRQGQRQATVAFSAAMEAAARQMEQKARELERRAREQRAERERRARERRAEQAAWVNRMKEGKPLDIPVVRDDGHVVGTVNAQISLERMLLSVLSTSPGESGEITFALDQQNKLHTVRPEDRRTLESLGLLDRVRRSKQSPLTVSNGDWVMVSRRDPSGVVFGIARPIGKALAEMRRATGRNLGLGMLAIMVALVGIVPVSRRMTRNISVLHSGVTRIAHGDLGARVPVQSKDEIGHLAQAFNQMAEDLGAHQKLLAERERLRTELDLCRQIQAEMLPKHPLRLGFAEIRGVSIPAREVGGDFFNYFLLPEGEVGLLVGDVSGKGVGAALLMANIQATLSARLPVDRDLAHLSNSLDREVESNTPTAVYLTLFVGILDSAQRSLRYVNAGHNPQFVLRAGGGLEKLPSTGLPLGMFAGHGYKEASVDLSKGDVLFFYTDGVTEVENEKGEMFGTERLERLLVDHHQDGVDVLLARIEQDLSLFRGHAEPFDDATMMVLRVGA